MSGWTDGQAQLSAGLDAVAPHPSGFRDTALGYIERYGKSWTTEMAKQASGYSTKGGKGTPGYGNTQRYIQRYAAYEGFSAKGGKQAADPAKASAANKAAIERAGQALPRQVKEGKEIRVTLSGNQGGIRPREWEGTLSAAATKDFIQRGDMAAVLDAVFPRGYWSGAESVLFEEGESGALEDVVVEVEYV